MKKIGVYSYMLLITTLLSAQNVRIEKSFDQSFYIGEQARLDITNKYGEVIVHTWYNDSIRIKVEVIAEGKSQDIVNKEMRRVDVDLRKIGTIVSGATKFDQGKSRGILADLVDQVTDYSKSVIGGNRVSVDYEIWVPEEVDISIDNKFGDIYLSTLAGVVSIDLSHGDLRGNKISNELMLKHSFGKHTFDYIDDGNLTLRGIDSKISGGGKLDFESSSSEISLGVVKEVHMISRNDKYFMDEVTDLIGEGTFTDLNLDYAAEDIRLDFDYGDIFLSRINKDFGKIEINGKSCDINMILDQASYINTSIVGGPEDQMYLPNSMLVLKKEILEEGIISLNGFVGNTNTTHSRLDIKSDGGELIISIKETDIFTNRD